MMHLKWHIVVVACALFVLPLFVIASPYIVFRFYVRNLPIGDQNIHAQESLQSVLEATVTSIRLPFACVFGPPVAQVEATGSGSPIHEVALSQRSFYGQVMRFAPSWSSFAILSKIEHAAECALALDDLVMLLEDGELGLGGVGDVVLLIHISKTSLAVRDSLFRILVHIELAVARTAFIQNTVLATMNILGSWTLCGSLRIEAIAFEATSSSARYILDELEAAINSTIDLSSALTRFKQDGRTQRQCARPVLAKNDSCADVAPLLHGSTSAQSVLALLTTLKAILEETVDGTWRTLASGTSECSLAVSHALTKAHVEALDTMVLDIAEARKAMQAGQISA